MVSPGFIWLMSWVVLGIDSPGFICDMSCCDVGMDSPGFICDMSCSDVVVGDSDGEPLEPPQPATVVVSATAQSPATTRRRYFMYLSPSSSAGTRAGAVCV